MDQTEQMNITLVVDDEKDLYNKFSPGADFSSSVKEYIRARVVSKGDHQGIGMTVRSRHPLDEEKFRAAVSNWIRDEKAVFRKVEKELLRTLVALLIVGSVLIILSLALEKRVEVLKYSLIPILGSLALSKAAGIMVIKMPVNSKNKRLINEMEKTSEITFEYGPAPAGEEMESGTA